MYSHSHFLIVHLPLWPCRPKFRGFILEVCVVPGLFYSGQLPLTFVPTPVALSPYQRPAPPEFRWETKDKVKDKFAVLSFFQVTLPHHQQPPHSPTWPQGADVAT